MKLSALLTCICALCCCVSTEVYAVPETIMEPASIIYGPTDDARFGTSVACSKPSANIGNSSYIAVGAPLADDGAINEAGKVYVYEPANPPNLLQTITSPNPGAGKHFGRAVAFIRDMNMDGVDELVIGEPYEVGVTGAIHVYRSSVTSPPYVLLDSAYPGNIQGFGTTLLGIRDEGLTDTFVVVGAPQSERVQTFLISSNSGGPIFTSGLFTATGGVGDRTGHSITEAWNGLNLGNEASDVLVGLPHSSTDQGKLQCVAQNVSPVDLFSGGPGDYLGSSVAGTHSVGIVILPQNASFRAFSVPGENSIKILNSSSTLYCSVSMPLTDIPSSSGTGLAHLKGSFMSLVVNAGGLGPTTQDTTFASYRDEPDTGGSVGIVGTNGDPSGCTRVVQLNNCLGGSQEQGFAITGGGTTGDSACSVRIASTDTPMLLVGSPAWSNNKGLVTVYYDDGSQHASPQACGASTPTPTATPTATPRVQATNTPSSGGGQETPIVEIQPGAALPPPIVTVGESGEIVVTLPRYTFATKFLQRLMKLLKLKSLAKAQQFAVVNTSFVLEIKQTSKASSVANVMFAKDKKSKVQKIVTRKNRVTLARLSPGTYQVTYRVVTTAKRIKKTFQTRASPPEIFRKT